MLPRNLDGVRETAAQANWHELSQGIPTLTAFVLLASRATAGLSTPPQSLSREAQALLIAARERGIFELRNSPEEFQSSDRLLAVCVEVDDHQYHVFRRTAQPQKTAAFLDGFRQLCAAGHVIHQSHREFCLTASGFAEAALLDADAYHDELAFGSVSSS